MGERLVIADIGASGGPDSRWDRLGALVLAFDPVDPPEETDRIRPIRAALGARRETRTFLNTRYGPASGLYSVAPLFSRFDSARDVEVVRREVVEVVDFDTLVKELRLPAPDFFKIDAQGAELEILQGAEAHIGSTATLGIAVEVWFEPPGPDIPSFGEIDAHLRTRGYHLFDLTVQRYARRGHAPPLYKLRDGHGQTATGQVVWGDALYLRDPVGDRISLPRPALTKLAALMSAYELADCADELARAYSRPGPIEQLRKMIGRRLRNAP